MPMPFSTIQRCNVARKRVLLRVDFNVPSGSYASECDFRIRAAFPTIRYLLGRKATVVLATHWGRPKKKDKHLSVTRLLPRVRRIVGREIRFFNDVFAKKTRAGILGMQGGVGMLENLRFWPQEEKGGEGFAKALASLADVYIDDAFGAIHRPHASISVVPKYLPSAAGFLVQQEIAAFAKVFKRPKRPLVFIMGGAKAGDKLGLLKRLSSEADHVMLGGALANTFLRAKGVRVGGSLYDASAVKRVRALKFRPSQLLLPEDVVVRTPSGEARHVVVGEIGPKEAILDIGPFTNHHFHTAVRNAGTVVWNGPVGLFEEKPFDKGTRLLAQAVARSGAFSIIGGGDLISALDAMGLLSKIDHVSTGGGAMLEFLAGDRLPGLAALGFYR